MTVELSIATISWARDDQEEMVLRRALSGLAAFGWPVSVADSGTNARFTAYLRTLPQFTVTVAPERGLVAQVQASISMAAANDAPFILYTEPDKEFFFNERLSTFLAGAPRSRDVGVVIPSRSSASFLTYPAMQQYTEGVANQLCADRIAGAGEYFYGPFLMNAALAREVERLDPRLGWGWRPAIFAAARRSGLRVVLQTGDYPCPPDQRDEDEAERLHRIRQLAQNVLGLSEV